MYDLSEFIDVHPGGQAVLLMGDVAGQDATESFFGLHSIEVLMRQGVKNLIIGTVAVSYTHLTLPTNREV